MQLSFWIFIKRFWASDRDTLKKLVDYIEALSYKFSMVVFPEGTDFTAETKEKSDSFARKNGLQVNAIIRNSTKCLHIFFSEIRLFAAS